MTEDEMAGWHHWLDGHEFEHAPGVGNGQGSVACCSPWGRKESDTIEWLNWTDVIQASPVIMHLRFLFRQLRFFPQGSLPESTMKSRIVVVIFVTLFDESTSSHANMEEDIKAKKKIYWKKRDKLDNIIWIAESSHLWSQDFPWSFWLHKPICSLFGLGWFRMGFYDRVLTFFLTSTDNSYYQLCLSCLTSYMSHITLNSLTVIYYA